MCIRDRGGMIDLGSMLGGLGPNRKKKRKLIVKDAYEPLINEESDNLIDKESLTPVSYTHLDVYKRQAIVL